MQHGDRTWAARRVHLPLGQMQLAPVTGWCSVVYVVVIVAFGDTHDVDTDVVVCHAGGRFLFAYQIMIALAVYLMATAIVDSSPSLMLSRQTRMLLSAGQSAFYSSALSILHHAPHITSCQQKANAQQGSEQTCTTEAVPFLC